jgi:hypothetical protein
MNIILTERYFCRKLRKEDNLFAIIATTMDEQKFTFTALNTKMSRLDPEFVKWHKRVIERKFGLNPKRKLLFPDPNVRQWIFDLAGEYQPDDLVDFFAQASGLSVKRLRRATIEDTLIDRPFLIDLVERLEEATGKTLSDPREPEFPLRYLGDVTFVDLAEYFSPKGSDTIDAIRRRQGLV